MRIKTEEDDVGREKIETPDGKIIVKDYVVYDPKQGGYLDATKYWASHYIELVYDSNGELESKTLKEHELGRKLNDLRTEFALNHSL